MAHTDGRSPAPVGRWFIHKNPKLKSYDLQYCIVTEQFPFGARFLASTVYYHILSMFWKTFWTTWAPSSKRGAAVCPGWTQRWPTSRDTVPSRSRRVLWGWKQMANNREEVTRMKCHGISTNHWGVSSWGDFYGENYGFFSALSILGRQRWS